MARRKIIWEEGERERPSAFGIGLTFDSHVARTPSTENHLPVAHPNRPNSCRSRLPPSAQQASPLVAQTLVLTRGARPALSCSSCFSLVYDGPPSQYKTASSKVQRESRRRDVRVGPSFLPGLLFAGGTRDGVGGARGPDGQQDRIGLRRMRGDWLAGRAGGSVRAAGGPP